MSPCSSNCHRTLPHTSTKMILLSWSASGAGRSLPKSVIRNCVGFPSPSVAATSTPRGLNETPDPWHPIHAARHQSIKRNKRLVNLVMTAPSNSLLMMFPSFPPAIFEGRSQLAVPSQQEPANPQPRLSCSRLPVCETWFSPSSISMGTGSAIAAGIGCTYFCRNVEDCIRHSR